MHVAFTTDETLLCRAEAYVMTEKYGDALNDLNTFMSVFSNAGPVTEDKINDFFNGVNYYVPLLPTVKKILNPEEPFKSVQQENFIHSILQLRRVLTTHVGLRWYDVKRYGIEIQRRQVEGTSTMTTLSNKLTKDDPRRALQLPQDVINAGMEANPR
jgi:hypothetical protein